MNRPTSTALSSLALVAAAGMLIAGPLNPPAGTIASSYKTLSEVEARTAVNAANTPGDSQTVYIISAPGSYYLTGNVTVPAGLRGIKITAQNVTLDLNGFAVTGVSTAALELVYGGGRCVTVKNGTLQNGASGVNLVNGEGCCIEDVTVSDVTGEGVRAGDHATIRRAFVRNAGSQGIRVFAHSRVEDCSVTGGGTFGGFYLGQSSVLTRCSVEAVAGDGITTDIAGVVTDCTARNCGTNGFNVIQSNVSRCAAYTSTTDGFKMSGRSMVIDCYATQNGFAGFRPLGTGVLRGCTSTLNMTGIRSETGSGVLILENECSDNTGFGIWMNGAVGCRIEGNHVYSNTGNGIYLNANGAHLVIRNTGRANGGGNFTFDGASDYGQILTNPGPGFISSNAWANFSY